MMEAIAISRSALNVEWQRLEVIAQNLANENTTRTNGGGAYQPLRLISGPQTGFGAAMELARPVGVRAVGIVEQAGATRRVLDALHPHADADGFVTYPDIDRAGEMALMIRTSRIYQANTTMLSMAQQMYMRALDLGKR
jgi:flagellar basal-body rod protein FlgC